MASTRRGSRMRREAAAPPPPGPASIRRPGRRLPWRLGFWTAVGLALLAAATGAYYLYVRPLTSGTGVALGRLPRGVTRDRLNLLFITLDTTRADRLGCYGDPGKVTPNLDRLASEGVLFERAIAPAPLTLPAHSTIFTGTIPPTHGVRDNGGYVLDARHQTLAGVLHRRGGWATGAFVAAFVLDGRWGLDQGFDKYFDDFDLSKYKSFSLGDVSRRGAEVVDAALPWLDQHAGQRFFAWLHFYDPHTPYDPPEPYKTRFAGHPYLGEIAYMDEQIGRVFEWLERRGLWDRTLVVAMGDHGESLNEHREGTHGLFVYDATMHVPLLVRTPFRGVTPRRVASVVRSEDVMPTVLDLLGIPTPREVQGRSLVPLLTGAALDLNLDAYSESYYPRFHYGWNELRALRVGRYKYIEAPRPELYDMERDAGETANLYDQRRALADRMAGELRRLEAAAAEGAGSPAASAPSAIDPETRERLAALGYIGTSVAAAGRPGERLPDPKDKIDLFNMLLSAREGTGRDQPERAVEYFKRALALNPDSDVATMNLANVYRRLGRLDAAIAGYERYLQRDPRNGYVHYLLGELFSDMKDARRAAAEFQRALDLDPRIAAARNALGVLAFERGDVSQAEQEIREALRQKPDVKLAHYNLALIAESRGDLQAAIAEYRRELALQQGSYKAAFNLAKLYERLGDRPNQQAALEQAIEANPRFAEGYFYLAKFYLDRGEQLDRAIDLAQKGLELAPRSEYAPLGHYVLADVYNRLGRNRDAAREAVLGRALEGRRQGQR